MLENEFIHVSDTGKGGRRGRDEVLELIQELYMLSASQRGNRDATEWGCGVMRASSDRGLAGHDSSMHVVRICLAYLHVGVSSDVYVGGRRAKAADAQRHETKGAEDETFVAARRSSAGRSRFTKKHVLGYLSA